MAAADRRKLDDLEFTMDMLHAKEIAAGKSENFLYPMASSLFAVGGVHQVHELIKLKFDKGKKLDCSSLSDLMCDYLVQAMSSKFFNYNENGIIYICKRPKVEVITNLESRGLTEGDLNSSINMIKCQCIIAYRGFCSHYTRTVMINPTTKVKENYNFMVSVEQKVIENLKVGALLCEVYNDVETFAREENPNMAKHLEKDFGFALNSSYIPEYPPVRPDYKIEDALKEYRFPVSNFKNESMIINADNNSTVQEHMLFAISIKLTGLSEEGIDYSLSISDTVLVKDNTSAEILTLFERKLSHCLLEKEIEYNSGN